MALKIIHANANILMANGLKALIQKGGGVDQLCVCKNESELFEELGKEDFDLVVIDPLANGYFSAKTAMKVKQLHPKQKVLIISDIEHPREVLSILEKGVQGYLTRQCDEDEIIHAIFAIAKGEKFYCNKVLDIILNKQFETDDENCEPTALTERESEITALIASGMTNKDIADRLHLSPHTVHTHRKNIIKKLGVKSVSELTVYAMNVGLIEA